MDEPDFSEEIAQLEDRIEALGGELARCAKIALGAKIAIAAGGGWFALLMTGIAGFSAAAFVAAMAAVLGGIVLLGSNATTWAQTEAAMREAEMERAELIGGMNLRVVEDKPQTIH